MKHMASCEHCGALFEGRSDRQSRFCSRDCYVAHPRPTGMVLPGEEELGVQRRCDVCGDWWPLSVDFFYRNARRGGFMRTCRACDCERSAALSRKYRLRRRLAVA